MSTTVKGVEFINEQIGDKHVSKLPGVGEVIGTNFCNANISKAYQVLGHFLRLDPTAAGHKEEFVEWFIESGCNGKKQTKEANQCYECLLQYCQQRLEITIGASG